MKFQIIDPKDQSNVMGGTLSENNVYIAAYGSVLDGYKKPIDLQVGESTKKRYALSGQKPATYIILRVE